MSEVRLAPAQAADIAAILALERSIFEAPHWPEAAFRSILREPDRRHLLAAHLDDQVVGFAVGAVLAGEADLENLAVHPAHRRGGVGRALCIGILEWAWAKGASTVTLEVRSTSAGAIALYGSLGFVSEGRRPNYYTAPVDDALHMRLRRGEAAL